MEVIPSYPSLSNGWSQELVMLMMIKSHRQFIQRSITGKTLRNAVKYGRYKF